MLRNGFGIMAIIAMLCGVFMLATDDTEELAEKAAMAEEVEKTDTDFILHIYRNIDGDVIDWWVKEVEWSDHTYFEEEDSSWTEDEDGCSIYFGKNQAIRGEDMSCVDKYKKRYELK